MGRPADFRDGFAAIATGPDDRGVHGFVDKTGKLVIPPQFDRAALLDVGLNEGLAAVRVGNTEDGKWGYIDKTGRFAINPQFRSGGRFSDGLAAVLKEQPSPWSFIDETGTLVVNPQFDVVGAFSEGLALAQVGDRWSYLDRMWSACRSEERLRCGADGFDASQPYRDAVPTGELSRPNQPSDFLRKFHDVEVPCRRVRAPETPD